MASFDIVNEIDGQEVDNAVNNTLKEVSNRYDFRGMHTEIEYLKNENRIRMVAQEKMKLRAMQEVLTKHFIKRKLDPKVLEYGPEEGTSHGHIKISAAIKEGIDRETAKKITKEIKSLKIKVQPSIMDDRIRVSGKKIDDLQEVIQYLKSKNMGIPLQFVNMK